MNRSRDYHDIPGTYVFDGEHSRKGYELNMFCMSLNREDCRKAFRADEGGYLSEFALTDAQRTAVLERRWLEMLQLGGNIYYMFKLAIMDGLTMQDAGAGMSGTDMTVDEFREMLMQGGRPIEGNRSRRENAARGR